MYAKVRHPRFSVTARCTRTVRWGALAVVIAMLPTGARAGNARLLEDELRLSTTAPLVLLAGDDQAPKAPPSPAGQGTAPDGSLDFDLLGAPRPPPKVDEDALRLRRTMLTWHQGVGFGMFALQLATTVVGQLNYNDKFGDNTGKYVQAHAVLAYSTLAAFVAAGTLALLAPAPVKRSEGFDRVTLHKISMFTAAAGMLAQGVLGVVTHQREGYVNQQSLATVHLAIGYATLAAVSTGIGALVL